MFSQLRNAVEQLAQQPIHTLNAAASPDGHPNLGTNGPSRSQSLDLQGARSGSPLSSTQLAENAISSLRKSFVSQRPNSVSSGSSNSGRMSSPNPTSSPESSAPSATRPKSNLEERLRRATKNALNESHASSPTSAAAPNRVVSPSPMSRTRTKRQDHSPASTPTGSPVVKPETSETNKELEQPESMSLKPSLSQSVIQEKPKEEDVMARVQETKGLNIDKKKDDEEVPEQTKTLTQFITEGNGARSTTGRENATKEPNVHVLEATEPGTIDEALSQTHLDDSTSMSLALETHNGEKSPPSLGKSLEALSAELPLVQELQNKEELLELPLTNESIVPAALKSTDEDLPSLQEEEKSESVITIAKETSPVVFSPAEETNSESGLQIPQKTFSPPQELILSTPTPTLIDQRAEVESLQARLKQIEQRFSDVSTSFKRLQAEKVAADVVLKEVSPLESINDAAALRDFISNLRTKENVFQDEIKRLNQKLELQEDRLEEIQETHKLESQSRLEEIRKLKTQFDETEALFQAAQRATSHAEEAVEKQKDGFTQLQKEVESAKNMAKEEEEKRVKAISLLKTVRQKLVKAEKDKDDAARELQAYKEKERDDKDKEQNERQNFQQEFENLNATHEKTITNMKVQFNKDFSSMKERYEQEINLIRGQFELEIASLKSVHAKELNTKGSQISALENSVNNITRDKNAFFDQLQLRQAEVESAQAHLESLQHQNNELQFQVREANDRLALLKEEYSELMREQESRSSHPATSPDEVARMISDTETKYEAKLTEMKRNLRILEKERSESEADWSRKLKEKVKEVEDLKRVLKTATSSREADENVVIELKTELARVEAVKQNLEQQVEELPYLHDQIQELRRSSKEQEAELNLKTALFERQTEEIKSREAQLKQNNRTLREELRKVQSSAALLERQRNPGVGYWTTRVSENNGSSIAEPRTSISSPSDVPSRTASPAPSTAASNKNEEEVNLEYLRNVILQFLEHKEMRPHLIKVLSIILHFTPQETRRLIAKV